MNLGFRKLCSRHSIQFWQGQWALVLHLLFCPVFQQDLRRSISAATKLQHPHSHSPLFSMSPPSTFQYLSLYFTLPPLLSVTLSSLPPWPFLCLLPSYSLLHRCWTTNPNREDHHRTSSYLRQKRRQGSCRRNWQHSRTFI